MYQLNDLTQCINSMVFQNVKSPRKNVNKNVNAPPLLPTNVPSRGIPGVAFECTGTFLELVLGHLSPKIDIIVVN